MKQGALEKKKSVLAVGLAGLAMILMAFITAPNGLVTSWDTVCYFQAARSFSAAEGFMNFSKYGVSEPMTQYPPLYAVLLGFGFFGGMDISSWARIVAIILFGVNTFMLSLMAFHTTGRVKAVLLTGVMSLVFVQSVQAHASALSEALCFTFMIASLWLLMLYGERGEWRMLIGAAVMAGLCVMTRYAGIAVVITGMVCVFRFTSGGLTEKLRRCVYFFVVSFFLLAVWLLHNSLATGSPVGFFPGMFFSSLKGLVWGVNTFYLYLFPFDIPTAARIGVMLIVTVLAAAFFRRVPAAAGFWVNEGPLVFPRRVIGIFSVVYFPTLVLSMFISNGEIRLEQRLLLPIPLMFLVLLPALMGLSFSRRAKAVVVAVLVIFLAMMGYRTVTFARALYTEGFGAYERGRLNSPVVKAVKTLPEDIKVYTDHTQSFYLYTGRPAIEIPGRLREPSALLPVSGLRKSFSDGKAVAVVFSREKFDPHPLWVSLGLTMALKDERGAIFVYKAEGKK